MEEGGSRLVSQDKEGALEGSVVVCEKGRTRPAGHGPGLRGKVHNNVTAVSCAGKELRKPIHVDKKHTPMSVQHHELKNRADPFKSILPLLCFLI